MKRYAAAVVLLVFVIQASTAQDAAHPELENALAEAVEKWELCPFEVEVNTYDSEGKKVSSKLEDEESQAGKLLSLQLMFRRGRFDLFPLPPAPLGNGKEARVIEFVPRKKKFQLDPKKGESEHLNKTLNRLRGTVYFDRGTGDIIRVNGNLHEEIWFSEWRTLWFPVFWLKDLRFSYIQEPGFYKWKPLRADGGYFYRKPWGGKEEKQGQNGEWKPKYMSKEFHLVFSCGA